MPQRGNMPLPFQPKDICSKRIAPLNPMKEKHTSEKEKFSESELRA
jgi:hypothetical protein